MISDNIRGTAAVAALASLAMLASAGVASAAAIGTPTIIDRDTTFVNDETVDLLGGDLGEAANFGLVGFDSIRLNAHTNGNIATAHAYVGAAFGNHAAGVDEPEVSYLGKVDGSINVSLPADSKIAFGQSNTIGQTDNGNSWTVNGNKLEMQTGGSLPKSERVLKDSKTVKYLDLKAMEKSMTSLSAKWSKTPEANATHDFSDMNKRHIDANGDVAHINIDAKELQGNRVTATLGEKTRLVVNVDAEGADNVTLPQLDVDGINHAEYAKWTDKGVIYNLTDSKSEDGQYHGRVGTAGATSSVILAPEADVDASQNVEGQIIAQNVTIGGEFHRNSVNVPVTRHVEVRLDGQDKTETTPFVMPRPAKAHYRFTVWTTNPDGTGDSYKPGETVTSIPENTTLYPQWEAKHVLRYDMNGGDGQYEDSDLPADVSDTAPTRDGYEFDGWMIDGVKVDSDNTVEDNGSDVTVVAQWTPVRQDVTPTKPDTPKNDTDKPSGTDTNVPSKDDSGKTDTDKPSDTNTPKGQSDATSKAESPKDGLASTGVAVAAVAVAVVALAAGAIALAILGKRK
ncbi:collagen-binding domain-containing protein [Bifidobacterium adolescentis]|uniref:Transposase n=1 Tax=Bifidobacterium adolescentis TaxID=1680 RepID=A0A1X2Z8D1_BIFAD|nr:collagen-binding domain-containing protein [Bifidobacterium adolescentis]OSG90660.1 transposase [Bifidobacterium adolescentis]